MSDETLQRTVRRRASVARSVKGVYTFEATIEIVGDPDSTALLVASDSLVAELEARYPLAEII